MSKELKLSAKLIRQQLGSIGLSDVKSLGEIENNKNLAEDAELFYRNHFKAFLKALIQQSLENIATSPESLEQLMFGRGSIDLAILIDEWFQKQTRISLSKHDKEKDEPNTAEPFKAV